MKKIVRNDGAEITLGQWMAAVRSVEGIRLHEGRGFNGIGEVFDARFSEWVEAFVWRDGVVHVNASPEKVDRVIEPLLQQLDAAIVEDE